MASPVAACLHPRPRPRPTRLPLSTLQRRGRASSTHAPAARWQVVAAPAAQSARETRVRRREAATPREPTASSLDTGSQMAWPTRCRRTTLRSCPAHRVLPLSPRSCPGSTAVIRTRRTKERRSADERMSGIPTTLPARVTDLAGTSPAGALPVALLTSAHAGPRAHARSSSMTYLTFLVSCAYACVGASLRKRRKEYAPETFKIDAEVCAYAQRRVEGVAGAKIKRNFPR